MTTSLRRMYIEGLHLVLFIRVVLGGMEAKDACACIDSSLCIHDCKHSTSRN